MSQLEPTTDELLRQAIRATIAETAAQSRGGWRNWLPPAAVTLIIFTSGMITGAAIMLAVLR